MIRKVTAKEAKKIMEANGWAFPEDDGVTFFATNEEETNCYDFDSKKERDDFVRKYSKEV